MPGEELLPGGFPVALGRRFQTVLLQNVGDSAARNLMAQIGQRPLDSSVAPIPVLRGHGGDQAPDLILRPGTTGTPLLAAIIFPGDELTMPGQERLRRHDGGQLMKRPPAPCLGPDRQTTALVVVEALPLAAELLAQHTVLFLQLINDLIAAFGSRSQQGKSAKVEMDPM
jgi:hypothetical protein